LVYGSPEGTSAPTCFSCPDKKLSCPDKIVSCPDKKVSCPDKIVSCPDKKFSCPDKKVSCPDKKNKWAQMSLPGFRRNQFASVRVATQFAKALTNQGEGGRETSLWKLDCYTDYRPIAYRPICLSAS
jgi:hypothetical protein